MLTEQSRCREKAVCALILRSCGSTNDHRDSLKCIFNACVAHILPNHARSTAKACFYVCECYVCVVGSVGCGLKAEHGNIMDVLEEKKTYFFVLSDMSLPLLPKQLIAPYFK